MRVSLFFLSFFLYCFLSASLPLFRPCGGNNDDGAISRCKAATLRETFSLNELDVVTKLLNEFVQKFATRDVTGRTNSS